MTAVLTASCGRERRKRGYGGDDVDGPRNEGRRDVGNGEIADPDHLEIVESVGGEARKAGQGEMEQVADLHNAARILFVLDDLEKEGGTQEKYIDYGTTDFFVVCLQRRWRVGEKRGEQIVYQLAGGVFEGPHTNVFG